ncbi:Ski2-like ATP-dependent RNA helicase [Encephalitozoon intestinalis ATCC 50506]|uniref:Ski2-like ATP-dependent RNA helicase n=1 Tax=Encephalitozoon intestinalis (strain ATCC 50506) TaxID=876142 RepID=E0S806_ENCIT|nr:Ski2-like ATP-dependent RNA helicase [Encephalitozoon intestinalis ATCC 50506]ADM11841.1 Ski2-like ATP-dependent RNA helicase [Encephalitozoon intestinalis ATCC 50506]UTX45591.1 pre-mRNA splicing helicase [Encephalitozoon intestinalis]
MDGVVRRISNRLGTMPKETTEMISQALKDPSYQERLVEILGYEMMEEVEMICANKEYFVSQEEVEDHGFYVEYNFPESIPIEVDCSEIVSTDVMGGYKKYFDYKKFNGVQSKVFNSAYQSDGNMLVCAPTSSGKTDIAFLCVLRALGKGDKVVYVVPMRALATEIASKYRKKLGEQRVVEYTGDTEIKTEDVARCDVIVSTPEKFDVATRRQCNVFQSRVGLVILDEVHMLQDERGPVLEAIVCRVLRYVELRQRPIRVVGLSATLPNYEDVGRFLRAEHVFSFDQGYRPVPLKMQVVGMKKRSKLQLEDEFLKKKVERYLSDGKQVLVFVHSRGETSRTAKLLSDDGERRDVKGGVVGGILLELARRGVGIHHAGLPRKIRLYMEDEFKAGRLRILVTTSTLAWGVNLPAYAVVIKGTRFYDSSQGGFRDVGILDVLQIFGRAGRPQFDSRGEGCLITTGDKMDHYVSLLKNSRDVESRLLRHVADIMNAEIYLNTIEDVNTAVEWLRSTFMYVRMSKNPMCYGLSKEDLYDEYKALSDYAILTCRRLEECSMIRIHRKRIGDFQTWRFCSTEYGRIASMYYLSHETMERWLREIEDIYDEDSILRLCFEDRELSVLGCREEDEESIKELCMEVGVKYEVSIGCKLMVLVKAHIKRLPIQRFSLACDSEYVVKNLRRILMGLCQILIFQCKHLFVAKCCILLKRIERQKEKPWDANNRVEVDLFRVLGMVRMEVSLKMKGEYWIFVWDGDSAIYSGLFAHRANLFIKTKCDVLRIEIVARDEWARTEERCWVSRDTSTRSLYHNGVHECDQGWSLVGEKQSCSHFCVIKSLSDLSDMMDGWRLDGISEPGRLIMTNRRINFSSMRKGDISIKGWDKRDLRDAPGVSVGYLMPEVPPRYVKYILCDFSLRIKFVQIDCMLFRERLQLMSSCITFMDNYESKKVVIVAPDTSDMERTAQDLETRMTLKSLSCGKCDVKVRRGRPMAGDTGIFVTAFDRRLEIQKDFTVIFKGCSNSNGYFPIFEVLRICDSREALIYEGRDYIEYFNSCVLNGDEE